MYDYTGHEEAPATKDLAQLEPLVQEMREAEREVNRIEEELDKAKARLKRVQETQIPELMSRIGLKEFTTGSGFKVTVKKKLRHSLSKDKKPLAFKWLEDNGYGDIIKRMVGVPFAANEQAEADELLKKLEGEGLNPTMDRDVHSSTLKALIQQLRRDGKNVPLETFGAYDHEWAEVSE